jgi:glycosyltransferase involved in cell wall biosynthesis
MKILFKNRFNSFESPGGDTVQMLKTKEYLEKMGLKIDISLDYKSNLQDYDLVHIFNCMRPLETSASIFQAKEADKKVILSSIYWDFNEFNLFGRSSNFERLLYRYLNEFTIEKIKDARRVNHGNLRKFDILKYYLYNYKKTLKLVDRFLPNSINEGEIIRRKIFKKAQYSVVYNAVDKESFYINHDIKRKNQTILAARIDPRKNILNLVKAITKRELNIYGDPSDYHLDYFNSIKNESKKNINFYSSVSHNDLLNLYNSHMVHILPSWLETPGLSQLEAAACGCNIVSTSKGSAFEYFKDKAKYCDPGNINSISEALENAFNNLVPADDMSAFVLDNYTWETTAKQTLAAYEKVIN